MRSDIEWETTRIDLPSLTSLIGEKYNFTNIGSITLESTNLSSYWFRCPAIVIWRYPPQSWLLLVFVFASVIRYMSSFPFFGRCWWSKVFHHKQMVVCTSLVPIRCCLSISLHLFVPSDVASASSNDAKGSWHLLMLDDITIDTCWCWKISPSTPVDVGRYRHRHLLISEGISPTRAVIILFQWWIETTKEEG